jgi:hypothetical protein
MDFERLIDKFGLSVEEEESMNPVVLSIMVEVDHQRTRKLEVRRYDDPFIASSKFCREHSLSPRQRDIIEREISSHLTLQESKHLDETPMKKSRARPALTPSKARAGPSHASTAQPRSRSPLPARKVSQNNLRRQREQAEKAQKENEKEMRECTFKPEINMVSSILAQNKAPYTSRNANKVRLFDEALRKQQQELEECTFKPVLN